MYHAGRKKIFFFWVTTFFNNTHIRKHTHTNLHVHTFVYTHTHTHTFKHTRRQAFVHVVEKSLFEYVHRLEDWFHQRSKKTRKCAN